MAVKGADRAASELQSTKRRSSERMGVDRADTRIYESQPEFFIWRNQKVIRCSDLIDPTILDLDARMADDQIHRCFGQMRLFDFQAPALSQNRLNSQ
ncbi:hypothetical protein WR25_22167 [Diploscapter pachys]|uniref:Uncharacterized protein n=1 Tax=Diploscapter pachys TaxID=2018661 RepID=A0A2A2JB11_9BILA|nr:hypothetical protein WR25_22167 [Diploscapter pachys]